MDNSCVIVSAGCAPSATPRARDIHDL